MPIFQAERKLTQKNRDDLYDANVNPIATFPGQGVTVFGQKTLQKKSSELKHYFSSFNNFQRIPWGCLENFEKEKKYTPYRF